MDTPQSPPQPNPTTSSNNSGTPNSVAASLLAQYDPASLVQDGTASNALLAGLEAFAQDLLGQVQLARQQRQQRESTTATTTTATSGTNGTTVTIGSVAIKREEGAEAQEPAVAEPPPAVPTATAVATTPRVKREEEVTRDVEESEAVSTANTAVLQPHQPVAASVTPPTEQPPSDDQHREQEDNHDNNPESLPMMAEVDDNNANTTSTNDNNQQPENEPDQGQEQDQEEATTVVAASRDVSTTTTTPVAAVEIADPPLRRSGRAHKPKRHFDFEERPLNESNIVEKEDASASSPSSASAIEEPTPNVATAAAAAAESMEPGATPSRRLPQTKRIFAADTNNREKSKKKRQWVAPAHWNTVDDDDNEKLFLVSPPQPVASSNNNNEDIVDNTRQEKDDQKPAAKKKKHKKTKLEDYIDLKDGKQLEVVQIEHKCTGIHDTTVPRSVGLTRAVLNQHLGTLGLPCMFGQSVVSSKHDKSTGKLVFSHLTLNLDWNDLPEHQNGRLQWWLGLGEHRLAKARPLDPAQRTDVIPCAPIFWAEKQKNQKGGALCSYIGHYKCVAFETKFEELQTKRTIYQYKQPAQALLEFKFAYFDKELDRKMTEIYAGNLSEGVA